jgi:hypothetical protein
MLHRIKQETSKILQISEEIVWVYISDIPAQGVLEFGNVLPEPGDEEKWLASLPRGLREKLRQASIPVFGRYSLETLAVAKRNRDPVAKRIEEVIFPFVVLVSHSKAFDLIH